MAEAFPQKYIRCLNCNFEGTNEVDFLNHVRIHQYEKNFRIPCSMCPQVLKTIQLYKKHKKACKGNKTQKESSLESNLELKSDLFWVCQNCNERIQINNGKDIDDFDLIIKHMYSHSRSGEVVSCPICESSYKLYKSFSQHIVKHKLREETKINFEDNSDRISVDTESNIDLKSVAGSISDLHFELDENSENNNESNFIPNPNSNNKTVKSDDLFELNSVIEKNEALFALKLSSKYLLPIEVVNEIFSFNKDIHTLKMEFVTSKLKHSFSEEDTLKLCEVTETIDLCNHFAGLGDKLTTNYKREKVLNCRFDFIQPQKVIIGRIKNEVCFYYSLPIVKTLSRLMNDNSIRDFLIHLPTFDKQSVSH